MECKATHDQTSIAQVVHDGIPGEKAWIMKIVCIHIFLSVLDGLQILTDSVGMEGNQNKLQMTGEIGLMSLTETGEVVCVPACRYPSLPDQG